MLPFLRHEPRRRLVARLCEVTDTSSYRAALACVQQYAPRLRSADDTDAIDIIGLPWEDVPIELREGLFEPAGRGSAAPTPNDYRRAVSCIRRGMEILRDSEDRADLLGDLVDTVVVGRNPGAVSGSARHALGAVVIYPTAADEGLDAAALLLHESVHQALWLAEMVGGVFRHSPQEIDTLSLRALSPIRRRQRRFDSAFHAACVAVELASWHADAGRAEQVGNLTQHLPESVASLTARRDLFTPYGRELLDDLTAAASTLTPPSHRG